MQGKFILTDIEKFQKSHFARVYPEAKLSAVSLIKNVH